MSRYEPESEFLPGIHPASFPEDHDCPDQESDDHLSEYFRFFPDAVPIVNGFEVVKDGLLLIGAIGLFLVAGMLLAKGKKENADEKKEAKNGWRQHFSVIGLKTVVLMISVAFLLLASVADLILLNL